MWFHTVFGKWTKVGRAIRGARPRQRVLQGTQGPPSLEVLEDRTLLSVSFVAGPLQVPAVNRPDLAPGDTRDGPIEPFVSVNPTDPGNLAVTSQDGLQVSTNAGGLANFTATQVYPLAPGYTSNQGDTATVYDAQGRLFWANLETPAVGFRDVVVAQVNRTTGAIIGNPVAIPHPAGLRNADKEFLAADSNPNSPWANNLYLSIEYYNATDDQFELYVSRSTNQGATWSTPQLLSVNSGANTEGFTWPNSVSVAPNGDVYVAYHAQPERNDTDVEGAPGNNPNGNMGQVIVFRSTDGGVTFPTALRTVPFTAGQADITFNRQDAANGRLIPGTQFWTMGSAQPWVLADPARPGRVYIVTADDPNNGGAGDNADVVFARSGNNGANWITSTIESGPNNSFQLFPNASIDQFGNIVVSWYTNASLTANGGGQFLTATNGNGNFLLNVWARYSTDGGLNWSPSFQVNDLPIDPDVAVNNIFGGPPATTRIGEYFGIANFGGTAYVAWRDSSRDAMNNPVGPSQVLFDAFPINGTVVVNGDDNGAPTNDDFVLRRIAGNTDFIEIINNAVLVNGNPQRVYAGLMAGVAGGINVNGLAGNDTFTVDSSNGLITVPVHFDGGSGFDRLNLLQTGGPTRTTDSLALGSGPGNGRSTIGDASGTQVVDFDNVEPITDNVPAASFNITSIPGLASLLQTSNTIDYSAGLILPSSGRVTVDTFEPIEFSNKTTLVIDAGSGSDQINLSPPATTPTGLTGITIDGGAPGGTDTLTLTGTSAAETFEYASSGAGAGILAVTGSPNVTFSAIEAVEIDGGSNLNDDTLIVRSEAGADRVTLTPGANVDSGTFAINSTAGTEAAVPLSFRGLGQDAFIDLRSGGAIGAPTAARDDTFEYLGTDTADLFSVTAANGGTVVLRPGSGGLNARKEVRAPGASSLILQGLADDDTFDVAPGNPFTGGVTVNGADPTGSDVLIFSGSGAAYDVNLGAVPTIGQAGGGTVSLTGVERVNLNHNNGTVNVSGTNGDDTVHVTPTGAGAGTFVADSSGAFVGRSPLFTYTSVTTLTVSGGAAGFDVLHVLGTTGADNVTSGASTVTNSGGTVTAGAGLERLDVSTFDGDDTINLANFTALSSLIQSGDGNDTVTGTPQADRVEAGAGNDTVNGGAGGDVLLGEEGDDRLDGDAGTDQMFGGPGNDTAVWDPGDGSDLVEGGTGDADVLRFNGSAAAEVFTLNPNGDRFQLLRNVGAINMDVAEVEQVDLNALGGADSTTVNDLSGTSVRLINLDLGAGDGAADAVTVNGRGADDYVNVGASGGVISVTGLPWTVRISNAAAATDRLFVEGNDGNDTLRAEFGAQGAIALTLDGNGGNDTLTGGATVIGGPGHDTLDLSAVPGVGIHLNAFTPQFAGAFGTVQLGDLIENFRGGPSPDAIEVIPLATGRDVNGGGGGDLLNFNSFGLPVLSVTATSLYTLGLAPVTIHGIGRLNWVGTTAANVTPIMWVNARPKRFRGRQGRFDAVFTFRNVSDVAVEGPFGLFLEDLTPGVRVLNRAGFTGALGKVGSPFVRFSAGDQLINPGEEFRVVIKFFTAVRRNVHFKPGVTAGSGPY